MDAKKVRVNILMSTYFPNEYLLTQLETIKEQADIDSHLYVRDDASRSTKFIKECISITNNNLVYFESGLRNLGPAASFLKLLRIEKGSPFVAFSDQDDIWMPNKIKKAVEAIGNTSIPTLYYSNAFLYGYRKNQKSTQFKPPAIPRSCFENSAMGCTIVVNRSAAEVIKKYSGTNAVMHDWACLIIILICGQVIFDEGSTLSYRIHDAQTVGYRNKRTLKSILGLTHLEQIVSQLEEITETYSQEIALEKQNNFWKIIRLKKSHPYLFYFLIMLYPQRFRVGFIHELIFRAKFFTLGLRFILKPA